MTSTVERRPALPDYPRPATMALGTVEVTDANRSMVRRRRELWSTYLRCTPADEAAVATKYAPILLDMILRRSDEELPVVPGSHYPHGFRQHVLGHTALPDDAIGNRLSAKDESGLPFLDQLREILQPDSNVPITTLRSVAQLLNVLGLFAVSAKALGRRALDSGDPLFVYEVARSFYVLDPDSDRAVQPFHSMADDKGNPLRLRLSAYARLIAHYCRRDRDLGACEDVARDVGELMASVRDDDSFEIRMGISRCHRALALYAVRRRDMRDIARTMQVTIDHARGLSADAATPAENVAAAQNERLSLEASLKAFISAKGRAMVIDMEPGAAVDRLLELDPWDPYTRLYTGDVLWMLGQDERALDCFMAGGRIGAYPGALAAARAGVALAMLDRKEEADRWSAIAVELDPAAASATVPTA